LDRNQLSGTLPNELGNLSNLEWLWLFENQLSGPIPQEFSNLNSLEEAYLQSNQISSLIDFSALPLMDRLWVQNNNLDFDDLEPNLGIADFQYAPQGQVSISQSEIVKEGQPYSFTVTIGGADNIYQWFKDGEVIPNQTSNTLQFNALTRDDEGNYVLLVTNSAVTNLSITTTNLFLSIIPGPDLIAIDEEVDIGDTLTIDIPSSINFPPNEILSLDITNTPVNGFFELNNQVLTYWPAIDASDREVLTYRLCNLDTLCSTADINISIFNEAPVIEPFIELIDPKGSTNIPLPELISDFNGNLDSASIRITTSPISGAPASITDLNLTVDYSNSSFTGRDRLSIEACDLSAACTEQEIQVIVGELNQVNVYNGVTPNNDGRHDFLELEDLQFFTEHTVTVFDRLGEVLFFRANNYSNANDNNSFIGIADDGSELGVDTYFYYIKLVTPLGNQYSQSGSLLLKK
jgi:gliding motility-associated-like protein